MTALPPDVVADLEQENALLQAELRAARERQIASAEILRTIASTPGNAEQSLQQIAETTARLFGAPSVTVLIADGNEWGKTIRVGDGSKRIGSKVSAEQRRIGGPNLPGTVVRENRQIHIPDLDNIDATMADWPAPPLARAAGIRVIAGTPLRREGRAIGALIVFRDRPLPFTAEELALQQSFADQAVIAIENARLFNETKETLERQTATADILKVIASSPSDVQPVFDVIVERAVRLCGGRMGRVYRYDDGIIHLVAGHGLSEPGLNKVQQVFPRPAADDTTAGRAIQSRRPNFVTDIRTDESVPALSRQMIEALGTRSQVTVPMLRSGEPIGAITVGWADPGAYGDQQVALLQTFADQAVIAIANVRLFEEVQAKTSDLTEALQQQTATADVLKVISRSAFDLKSVLTTLTHSAVGLCGATFGVMYLRDGELLRIRAESGCSPALFDFLSTHPMKAGRETFTGRAFMTGEISHMPDVLADPEFNFTTAPQLGNFRAGLAVPLMRDGRVEGAFSLARREAGPFTSRQIELVKTFADQAVIAIENVRLFDEVQARTRELSQSLEDLRTAQDRLVQTEKLASLGQLTAGIAHEIKNPLNFVNNFAALSAELTDELNDVLASAALTDKMREEVDELTRMLKDNLQRVVQHGKRADSIVKNMLLHSREGSGEHRPADINALLDESLNLAYHGARAEKPQFNVTLQRDFDEMAGMIDLFPQEITRVFLNLISNGFYAVTKRKTENGGSGFEPMVSAATRNLGDTVEIRIRDNGTGIPPEVKEKMFNPFFTTKPAGEGTGLGLSMSHDIIVKQHGGRIDVETEPGQFTEFRIVLPRTSRLSNKERGQT